MEANSQNTGEVLELPSKNQPLKSVLKSTDPLQCKSLEKTFEKKAILVRHAKTVHPGLYDCPECSEQFVGPPDLLRHMREEHQNMTSHNCIECGESFSTKTELQCHRKAHKGRPAVYCDKCDQTFAYKKDLKIHIKEVHKQIPRLTNEEPVIIPNYVITDNGKSVTLFRCNLCTRAFNLKTDLIRHFLVHSGEKPFNCDLCESRFNRRSNLLRHRRSMHNVIDTYRYQKSDLRQRRYMNREIWQIESEAIAEEERIIRDQEILDKQRRADARMRGFMHKERFSEGSDLIIEDNDDDHSSDDFTSTLIESNDIPETVGELSLLQPDEKITVRILTFDS